MKFISNKHINNGAISFLNLTPTSCTAGNATWQGGHRLLQKVLVGCRLTPIKERLPNDMAISNINSSLGAVTPEEYHIWYVVF